MAGEWPHLKIEEVAEKVAMGPFGSSIKVSTFVPTGIPVISGQHLHGTRLQDTEYNFITPEHAEKLKNANVYRGDVIFTHAGNIGQAAYIPPDSRYERYVISQRQFFMRCNAAKIRPSFVAYFFRTHEGQHKLLANSSPSGVPSIAQPVTYLRTIEIPVPPLPVQDAIVSVLGTLDDKIELSQRMKQTLEEMARAVFRSWFLDFDPVRARAEGRDPGVPPRIASLFPDSLEKSEGEDIPSGWGSVPLSDLMDINPTRHLRKGEVAPYLDMASMPTRGHYPDGWIERPFGSGMRFINGDTLVARITPCLENGKTAMVTFLNAGQVGWGSTEFIVLRPKPPLPPAFAYLLARSPEFRQFAIQRMSGSSGRQRVPADDLRDYRAVKPSDAVAGAFRGFVEPLFDQADNNARICVTLSSLRDTLLPKLVLGELRIPDAERIVGRAL